MVTPLLGFGMLGIIVTPLFVTSLFSLGISGVEVTPLLLVSEIA